MKFIVIAGGQGTKLWPMSREDKPKQFQPVVGEKSLFRQNLDALLKDFSSQDVFVSTKRRYVKFVIDDAKEIPLENIIIEPDVAKNTGPATGLAVLKVSMKYPKDPFMIVQADCLRIPDSKFVEMIKEAEKLVKEKKKLITGGQKALYPDMGIDYLMLGDPMKNGNKLDIFKIQKFIPRLDSLEETRRLIRGFRIATHSNHYCWYPELLLNAFKKYKPTWYRDLMKIKAVFGSEKEAEEIDKIYEKMDSGPVEDVTKNIFSESYIILNPFKWMDMGTWGVIHEYLAPNDKTYQDGNVIAIETRNSFIKGRKEKLIATVGIENLLIVDTEDVLFVCPKNRSQEVKKIVEELKKKGKKYL
ncbi:MAG: sugar phosphate nucleotidyltransferase [Patescibacteria group bacterium]|nr:sugar phosphate nucleotidyltransferase [Patescibacteria group bacterium]